MGKILLTGASSGIGEAICKKLYDNGYELIVTVRKNEDKERLEKQFDNIQVEFLDVTNHEEIDNLYNKLKTENVELSAIINNAGIALTGIMESPNFDDLRHQIEVNSLSPLKIATTFLPLIKQGKIINISSESSSLVCPFITPYSASKRLLDSYFQGLNIELNNDKIKIVSIKPAIIKTPIWDKSIKRAEEAFYKLPENIINKYQIRLMKLLKDLEKKIPNGLEPEKVADKVLNVMKNPNPKFSYDVGFGAIVSTIVGKLSEDLQKTLIKISMS